MMKVIERVLQPIAVAKLKNPEGSVQNHYIGRDQDLIL